MSKSGRGNRFAADVPAISIASVSSISEGQILTINITRPSSNYISSCVVYSVFNSAGLNDFVPVIGEIVTFLAGETNKSVTVTVSRDLLNEVDETFFVVVANPINATIGNSKCLVTILGNITAPEEAPLFNVAFVSSPLANEGENLVFNVGLSGTTVQAQTIPFDVSGTAIAGTDYAIPFLLSNGVTVTANTFNVPIGVSSFQVTTITSADFLTEPSETVILTAGGIVGTGTISNVEPAIIQSITVNEVSEGGLMVFTITTNKPTIAGQVFTPILSGAA